ncbi:MAG: hypothetical protein D6808_07270 [Candidatus Dadabacteria bacterium]|nr:MAG: hypothetical protein D6808_07270 [Candidatus Dadabacteria bacterium]
MMCFFLVMWLVNTADVVTKANIASYFRKPGLFDTGSGTPLMIGQSGILRDAYVPVTKHHAGSQGGANDTDEPGERGEEEGKYSSKGGPNIGYPDQSLYYIPEERSGPEDELLGGYIEPEGDYDKPPGSLAKGKGTATGIDIGIGTGIKIKEGDKIGVGTKKSLGDKTGVGLWEGIGELEKGTKGTGIAPIGTGIGSGVGPGVKEDISTGKGTGSEPIPGIKEEQQNQFKEVAHEIQALVDSSPELAQLLGKVEVRLEIDGLSIEIMDTEKVSMFEVGSAKIKPEAAKAFARIGEIIGKLNNKVDIVGHTDSRKYRKGSNYTNWELSVDRANAARRILEKTGVGMTKISSVVGMADNMLKKPDDPFHYSNRRITIKIRFERPDITPYRLQDKSRKITAPKLETKGNAFQNYFRRRTHRSNVVTKEKKEAIKPESYKQDNRPDLYKPKEIITAEEPSVPKTLHHKRGIKRKKKEEDKGGIFKPKEIIKAIESRRKGGIQLPETRVDEGDIEPPKKDIIFKNNPVLDDIDIF